MIADGRAFGVTLALKHILTALEQKGVLSHAEITSVLDGALDELSSLKARIEPEQHAISGRAIGYLYVRCCTSH